MKGLLLAVLILFFSTGYCLSAETLADKLLASYDRIVTVTCEIRKTTETKTGKIRSLSRVYYEKPDRIHVDNITPLKRRIIADGSHLYSYIEGDPKGFSRSVDKLDDDMAMSLRKVPGTAMDHLLRLRGISEEDLDPKNSFSVRKGYQTDKVFVVLSMNKEGRLARIEFFDSAEMNNKTAQYDYSHFKEVMSGVWIPFVHKSSATIAGVESKETVRIINLTVNKPIAELLFIHGPFFKNVEFVGNFADIYDAK